jgi:hypothetical protein
VTDELEAAAIAVEEGLELLRRPRLTERCRAISGKCDKLYRVPHEAPRV